MMREAEAFGTVRFVNFLSPLLQGTYDTIARYVGEGGQYPTVSGVGQTLDEFAHGQADVGFLCGLLYVRMREQTVWPVELLAAPVLSGERYQQRPIYYSDVVVRKNSPYTSFQDLRGCRWAFNEEASHSGYNHVVADMLKRGISFPYFGETIKSGSHLNSLHMVLEGEADATAIDSHILDVVLRRDAHVASHVRIVDMFGPSSIPPVVVARRLDPTLKAQIQMALLTMHHDPVVARALQLGGIEHFVPVQDEHYQDIREMFARVQAAHVVL
jgi:phosphonate transport system substrate-binding protein